MDCRLDWRLFHTSLLLTREPNLRAIEMSRRQRFLGVIAHPQIAYLLLTLGILGLTVELWNLGAVLPGVAGSLSLLLAFFAFQVLPVNAAGLLLMLFGIGLLVLELKVPGFGALGVGGAISLFFGSVLTTRGVPGYRSDSARSFRPRSFFRWACCCSAAWHWRRSGCRRSPGRRADRSTGAGPVDDRPWRAGSSGQHGELWRAEGETPTEAGAFARVTAVNGLTLSVTPDASLTRTGDNAWTG